MEAEMRFHLEMETEKNIRRGMGAEEARLAARRSFGGVEQTKEIYRDLARFRWIDDLWQDLHYGARTLLKKPGFTMVAVLALAMGIGANTSIFSVVNAMVLNPLPYYDSKRLVWIDEGYNIDERVIPIAGDYLHWQAESKAFDQLVTFELSSIRLKGELERLDAVKSTASLFPALGVVPQLGRGFSPEEEHPGAAPVVVLSHALWQRRFGGDPAIIGQPLTFDGKTRQVVGVMPPDFRFIHKVDVYLPLALDAQKEKEANGGKEGSILEGSIIGRLKPGVSIQQALSELELILRRLELANPNRIPGMQVQVTPAAEKLFGHLRLGLLVLFGAAGVVLLITCANVANLLLARGAMRQKEIAIRTAIGAGRGRLVRQMLTESLLLSACGGVAGLLLAVVGVKGLVAFAPDNLAQVKESHIDGAALCFAFFASLLAGVVAGLLPALQTSQIDLNESLKEGARRRAFSTRKAVRGVSSALVVGELALTLVLLVGAGLLIKSFMRLRAVEPGYNPENLLTMRIPLYIPNSLRVQMKSKYQELLTRINNLPGVQVAAIGTPLPLTGEWPVKSPIIVGSSSQLPTEQKPKAELHFVSPDYIRAMGIRLLAGRGFTEQDNEGASSLVIINETMARHYFAGEDPIGKHFLVRNCPQQCERTVIGVVADMKRYGLAAEVQPEFYSSCLQCGFENEMKLVVRAAGDPLKLAPAARQLGLAIFPNLLVEDVATMEQRLAKSVAPRRFQMSLFGAFAALALVTAAFGVYGVIAYSVNQRVHEIGIRTALGASSRSVLLMIIRQGMSLALVGVAIGLAAALALTRLMASLLFDVKATDPTTFAGIFLLLVSIAFLATYLPARRAIKVDPMTALRHE
jgi:putative ABC transport system permease protein